MKRGQIDNSEGFKVPEEFKKIRKLWEKKDPECFRIIRQYVDAVFIPSNLLEAPVWLDVGDVDDIKAYEIEVSGLVFTNDDLPIVTIGAMFLLPTIYTVSNLTLEQWQEDHDEYLHNACSFEWILEPVDERDFPESLSMTIYDDLRSEIIE
jgi:hypothetical protein